MKIFADIKNKAMRFLGLGAATLFIGLALSHGVVDSAPSGYLNTTGETASNPNAQTLVYNNATSMSQLLGQDIVFKAGYTNTGAATLAINSFSAYAIDKIAQGALAPLTGGEIQAGQLGEVRWDGTEFILLTNYSRVLLPTVETSGTSFTPSVTAIYKITLIGPGGGGGGGASSGQGSAGGGQGAVCYYWQKLVAGTPYTYAIGSPGAAGAGGGYQGGAGGNTTFSGTPSTVTAGGGQGGGGPTSGGSLGGAGGNCTNATWGYPGQSGGTPGGYQGGSGGGLGGGTGSQYGGAANGTAGQTPGGGGGGAAQSSSSSAGYAGGGGEIIFEPLP